MFDEAGRLMRDHFWVADMAGVVWAAELAYHMAARAELREMGASVRRGLPPGHRAVGLRQVDETPHEPRHALSMGTDPVQISADIR